MRLPPQAAIIRLRFVGRSSRPLAGVKVDENGCSSITVRVNGRSQPELSGAAQARKQLQALLHRML